MSTVRIFEIAKELGLSNEDVIKHVKSRGLEATDHLSQLKASDAARLKDDLRTAKTVERRSGTVIRRSGAPKAPTPPPAPVVVVAPSMSSAAGLRPRPPGPVAGGVPSREAPPREAPARAPDFRDVGQRDTASRDTSSIEAQPPTEPTSHDDATTVQAPSIPTSETMPSAATSEAAPVAPERLAPSAANEYRAVVIAQPPALDSKGEPTLERAVVVRQAVSAQVMRAIEQTRREKGYDGVSGVVEGRPTREMSGPMGPPRSDGGGGPGGHPGGGPGGPGGGPGGPGGPLGAAKKKPPTAPGRRNVEEEKQRKYRHIIEVDDLRSGAGRKKARRPGGKLKGRMSTNPAPMKEAKRVVKMGPAITVGELAAGMSVKATEVIQRLFALGQMTTINQAIDFDTASLVADEFGWRVESVAFDLSNYLEQTDEGDEDLEPRPPVVTVMGHVDHGKTSLLDAIRKARVADGEAGGITQHIGAYSVDVPGKGKVVFIDTPGHEAFTAMRARGSQATDIVVLVVAADDGVMPQTLESINHAKAAGVPIVVAINKIDKDAANVDRVLSELSEHGLVSEEWGGETMMVKVSALKGLHIDQLLETILLQAEVLELSASRTVPAKGLVLEGRLERGRGAVATLLVQEGVLKVGDVVVSGALWGRVRALTDDKGRALKEAGPATPAEIIGLGGVPSAGDAFYKVKDDKAATKIVEHQLEQNRLKNQVSGPRRTGDNIYEMIAAGEMTELKVVVKADVQGSSEALKEAIEKLSRPEVGVKVIHTAVGGINESDVNLAKASRAIIIGFGVRPEVKAKALAEQENVDIRMYTIIYEALDDVQKAMAGLLSPVQEEQFEGRAEVRAIFSVPKVGTIAGCFVIDGTITRNAKVRVTRDSKQVYQGTITSLRRFKNDAREVSAGYECGIGVSYNELKEGDIIESFKIIERAATLSVQPTAPSR
ncbi:MAG: translation initiation factor IF-2 [Myxococcales bacterium]|nr:translation initiation factor IF-2 [Myxococcales bacterium]